MAPPAGWISLEGHLHGVLAVAISASISLFCIFGLVTFIGLLLWRYYKDSSEVERREKKIRNKVSSSCISGTSVTRDASLLTFTSRSKQAIRFLASTHGLLFIDLLVGDLLQAIGFAMNYSVSLPCLCVSLAKTAEPSTNCSGFDMKDYRPPRTPALYARHKQYSFRSETRLHVSPV